MKNNLLFIGIILICITAFSENRALDSLQKLLKSARSDTAKIYILNSLAQEYEKSSLDTALLFSQQAYKISNKMNYPEGMSRSANLIGSVYLEAGNYSKALEYYIRKLKIEEKNNDPEMLAVAIMSIAGVYHKEGDYNKAFSYAFRADSIINANKIIRLKLYSLLNLGDMFEKDGKIPSALEYTRKAYVLAEQEGSVKFMGEALNNLGNIYAKMGYTGLAILNYKKGLPYLETTNDESFIVESYIGLAKQYQLIAKPDSSLYYAIQSFDLSKEAGFLDQQLNACVFLSDYYKSRKDFKNAFVYKEDILVIKDSIYSKERIAKTQFLSMEEELRQKEISERKIQEAEDREVELQYLAIGLLLPVLFFITVYLSNRKIKPKFIEFLGVVSLLLTFEYIMLLVHPVIVSVSNDLPVYELLFFAVIASVLTPIHHRIEEWLLKILSRKERISLMKIRIE